MTPLQRYVRRCADRLLLRDWSITVERTPLEKDDVFADILEAQGCNATMRVSRAFYALSRKAQRDTVAHELLHLYTARLKSLAYSLATAGKTQHSDALEEIVTEADENVVERLAKLLAHKLPLPPRLRPPA